MNIKKTGRMVCRCLLFFLVAAGTMRVLENTEKLKESGKKAVILNEKGEWGKDAIHAMQKTEAEQEEGWNFTAWGERKEVRIENEELQRSIQGKALFIIGDSTLCLQGSTKLSSSDTKGCLIDAGTAETLFGSREVTGKELLVDGKQKIIRGLLYEAKDTVLYEAEDEDTAAFRYLTLEERGNGTEEEIRQEFMMRHGIEGKLIPFTMLYQMSVLCCVLIFLTASGGMLTFFGRKYRHRAGERGENLYRAAFLLCAAALVGIVLSQIRIPADMLPTKWSDFSFWGKLLKQKKEAFLLLLLTEKLTPMQKAVGEWYRVCGGTVLVLGMIGGLRSAYSRR